MSFSNNAQTGADGKVLPSQMQIYPAVQETIGFSTLDVKLKSETAEGSDEYGVMIAGGNVPVEGSNGIDRGAIIAQSGFGDEGQVFINVGENDDSKMRKIPLKNTYNIIDFDDQTLANDTDSFANILQGPRPFNPGDTDWVVDYSGVNKIQIPYAGLYLATFIIQFANNSTGSRLFSIYNLGGYGIPLMTTTLPANGIDNILTGSQFFAADAGELIQPVLKQTSGGNLAIVANGCSLLIQRIGDIEI